VERTNLVIAIDGPAASGKSTTARLVADRLGYVHLDTGAMYRAVTLKILRAGINPEDRTAIAELLASTHIELRRSGANLDVYVDGECVTEEIRDPAVTRAVSAVSRHREVRAAMVREQRLMGAGGGIVADGRDIGTVVFPDADLKFFVIANLETRALRREKELAARGVQATREHLAREIRERDELDSAREESPLRRAPDAIEIDTSALTIDDQVDVVVRKVRELQAQRAHV
jgi:cytidylate kinase